jgi:hypothetical protein
MAGYRKVPTIYTLKFDEPFEGLEVRLKSIKIGEMRRMLRLIDSDDDNTTDVLDNMVALIAKGIVSWNLLEEDGVTPVGTTLEDIDELDFDLLKVILDDWLDQVSGPSDDLGKDSPNGEKSQALSLTMEAL